MPDETVVATPEPATEPETQPAPEPASEPTPSEPRKVLTRQEARKALHDDLRQRREQTPEEEETEPDPSGEGGEPPASGEAEGGEVEKGEAEGGEAEGGETPKSEEPEEPKTISVPLPADHPVRNMGIEALTVGNEKEEAALRALINGTYSRRRDVEDAEQKIAQLQEQIARHESQSAGWKKYQETPEYQAAVTEYQRLKELEGDNDIPEGTSERYWRGVSVELQQLVDQEYQTRQQQFATERQEREARVWAEDAKQRQSYLPEAIRTMPRYGEYVDKALREFNATLGAGAHADLQPGDVEGLHQRFSRHFVGWLVNNSTNDPDIANALRAARQQRTGTAPSDPPAKAGALSQQERERIKREAVEEFKRQAATKRTATPPNPLGSRPGAPHTSTPSGEAGDDDLASLTPGQIKQRMRDQTRQMARASYQRR